jgi:hypothetical protein
MNRREFSTLLCGAATTWFARSAYAQRDEVVPRDVQYQRCPHCRSCLGSTALLKFAKPADNRFH